jgi:hypothetical protein
MRFPNININQQLKNIGNVELQYNFNKKNDTENIKPWLYF